MVVNDQNENQAVIGGNIMNNNDDFDRDRDNIRHNIHDRVDVVNVIDMNPADNSVQNHNGDINGNGNDDGDMDSNRKDKIQYRNKQGDINNDLKLDGDNINIINGNGNGNDDGHDYRLTNH